ncbi:hypothetical protein HYX09_03695 [Candidatus Woesearchaeota archaeon]|nr:hypothetical protein [Candidatus Woesearchaeota archaeon]MBI2661345.1 hypothetical protein [Candidatus Woesearchaeota archaeon]
MNLNKLFLLPVFLVLTLPLALADFQVEVTPVNDHIIINEPAVFNVTIKNYYDTDEEFRVRNFDYPVWDITTQPLSNPITLAVPKQSMRTIQIFVRTLQYTQTPVGTYDINARVDAETRTESAGLPLRVSIKSTEPLIGGYLPNVQTTLDVPEQIDPRQETPFTVSLKNLNPIKYDNLSVKVSGSLINEEVFTVLEGPGEGTIINPESEKSLEFVIRLDPMTAPREEVIEAEVLYNKRKIDSQAKKLKIAEYSVTEELPEKKAFLKSSKSVKVLSNNPEYEGNVKLPISTLRNLFTSTSPDSKLVNDGGKKYLVWDVSLKGEKEVLLNVSTNYRPLAVIVIFAAILVALYFLLRSPLTLSKGISDVKRREGGISEVKIVLRVKNRSPEDIMHIEVSDYVPHLADIDREVAMGSLHPAKIMRHPKKGTMIRWYVEKIEKGDERVLTYAIKSRLPILGELTLHPANARCRVGRRNYVASSNRVVAGA